MTNHDGSNGTGADVSATNGQESAQDGAVAVYVSPLAGTSLAGYEPREGDSLSVAVLESIAEDVKRAVSEQDDAKGRAWYTFGQSLQMIRNGAPSIAFASGWRQTIARFFGLTTQNLTYVVAISDALDLGLDMDDLYTLFTQSRTRSACNALMEEFRRQVDPTAKKSAVIRLNKMADADLPMANRVFRERVEAKQAKLDRDAQAKIAHDTKMAQANVGNRPAVITAQGDPIVAAGPSFLALLTSDEPTDVTPVDDVAGMPESEADAAAEAAAMASTTTTVTTTTEPTAPAVYWSVSEVLDVLGTVARSLESFGPYTASDAADVRKALAEIDKTLPARPTPGRARKA